MHKYDYFSCELMPETTLLRRPAMELESKHRFLIDALAHCHDSIMLQTSGLLHVLKMYGDAILAQQLSDQDRRTYRVSSLMFCWSIIEYTKRVHDILKNLDMENITPELIDAKGRLDIVFRSVIDLRNYFQHIRARCQQFEQKNHWTPILGNVRWAYAEPEKPDEVASFFMCTGNTVRGDQGSRLSEIHDLKGTGFLTIRLDAEDKDCDIMECVSIVNECTIHTNSWVQVHLQAMGLEFAHHSFNETEGAFIMDRQTDGSFGNIRIIASSNH